MFGGTAAFSLFESNIGGIADIHVTSIASIDTSVYISFSVSLLYMVDLLAISVVSSSGIHCLFCIDSNQLNFVHRHMDFG